MDIDENDSEVKEDMLAETRSYAEMMSAHKSGITTVELTDGSLEVMVTSKASALEH